MNTNANNRNAKRTAKTTCLIASKWLIVAAITLLIGVSSCVPPINSTTGQRASKREIQLANTSYSKSKKYKNDSQKTQIDENSAEDEPNYSANTNKIPASTEYDNIIEFEKKLAGNKHKPNSDQQGKTKTIPSLQEQLEGLEQRQKDTDENIDNIKGDLLEIKTMISDIAADKIKPAAAGRSVQTVNNQITAEEDNNQHNIIESDEANPDAIVEPAENPKVEPVAPPAKPKAPVAPKAEEPPTPKQNKNFKIVKATAKKAAPKEAPAAKEKPKPAEPAVASQPAPAAKSAENDFSGIIATIAKRDFATAAKQINDKMKNSKNGDVLANCNYWLGECSFNQRDYAKSIEYYKQALTKQCDKKDVAQVRIAEAYLRVGKNSEAKTAYQTLLRDHPKSNYTPQAKKMLQQL